MLPSTPHEFVVAPYSRQYAHRVYKIKEIRDRNERDREKDILSSRASSEFYIPQTKDNSKVHHSRRSFGIARPVSTGRMRPTSNEIPATTPSVTKSLEFQREEETHKKLNETLQRVKLEEESKKYHPKPWIPPRSSTGDCTDHKSKHKAVNSERVVYGLVNKAWRRSPWPSVPSSKFQSSQEPNTTSVRQDENGFPLADDVDYQSDDDRYPTEYLSNTPHVTQQGMNVGNRRNMGNKPQLRVSTSTESILGGETLGSQRKRDLINDQTAASVRSAGIAKSVMSSSSTVGLAPKQKAHFVLTGVLIDRNSDKEHYRHGILLVPKGSSALGICRAVEQQFNFRGISDLALTTQSGYGGKVVSCSISLGTLDEYPLLTDSTTFVAFTGGEPLDLTADDPSGPVDNTNDFDIDNVDDNENGDGVGTLGESRYNESTYSRGGRLSAQPARAAMKSHPILTSPEKKSVLDFRKQAEKTENEIREQLHEETFQPIIHNELYESTRTVIRNAGVFSEPAAEMPINAITTDKIKAVSDPSFSFTKSPIGSPGSPGGSSITTMKTAAGLMSSHNYLQSPSRGQRLWEENVGSAEDDNGPEIIPRPMITLSQPVRGIKTTLRTTPNSTNTRKQNAKPAVSGLGRPLTAGSLTTAGFAQQTVSSRGKTLRSIDDTYLFSTDQQQQQQQQQQPLSLHELNREHTNIRPTSVLVSTATTTATITKPQIERLKLDDFLSANAIMDYRAPTPEAILSTKPSEPVKVVPASEPISLFTSAVTSSVSMTHQPCEPDPLSKESIETTVVATQETDKAMEPPLIVATSSSAATIRDTSPILAEDGSGSSSEGNQSKKKRSRDSGDVVVISPGAASSEIDATNVQALQASMPAPTQSQGSQSQTSPDASLATIPATVPDVPLPLLPEPESASTASTRETVISPTDSVKERIQSRLAAMRKSTPRAEEASSSSSSLPSFAADSNTLPTSAGHTNSDIVQRFRSNSFESPESPKFDIGASYGSKRPGSQTRRASTNSIPQQASNSFVSEENNDKISNGASQEESNPEPLRGSLTGRRSVSNNISDPTNTSHPISTVSSSTTNPETIATDSTSMGNNETIRTTGTEKPYTSRSRAQIDLSDVL